MSAADRMVVRTTGGAYRSLPRRQALGLIAAGRAQVERGPQAPVQGVEAPTVPATPDSPPTAPQRAQDSAADLDDGDANDTPTPPDEYDPELEERRRAAGLKPGEWQAERGPITYPTLEPVSDAPDGDVPTVEAVELPEPPRGNAGRKDWADYAQEHLGIEVTSDMTRNQIRDAAQERLQSLARLPQPALTGGRLDTPEDEPATVETVADDEDPGTR